LTVKEQKKKEKKDKTGWIADLGHLATTLTLTPMFPENLCIYIFSSTNINSTYRIKGNEALAVISGMNPFQIEILINNRFINIPPLPT
jgi:hypothetical protein